ncbi:MAG: tetratricopeptide repeat protein [Bacteroidetes bacterium]|nr:MAG: tetratricopeptide repeat protein [Bacteroidota bacterium]
MKKLIYILVIFFFGYNAALAQKTAYNTILEANKLYEEGQYEQAAELYKKALSVNDKHIEAKFNLADALYKTEKYEEAASYFKTIAQQTKDKNIKSKAYHNLGNSLFQLKKLEEAQKAYQKALINNPKNEDARYNLAYVNELLRQQQNQNNQQNQDKQNNQQDKNKDQQQNQENKDNQKGNQDKDNKEQEGDNKEKEGDNKNDQQNQKGEQDKEDENKEKKEQNPSNGEQKDEKQEENKEQQAQPRPGELSPQDAKRLLDALNQKEAQTLHKLRKKKTKNLQKVKIDKDW